MCGGTRPSRGLRRSSEGLSPRVRGNRGRRCDPARRAGSIPACAGEPPWDWAGCGCPTVYPRVCGGTYGTNKHPKSGGGLSPRVRGNRERYEGPGAQARSIPACAGEPGPALDEGGYGRVYPRVCGGTAGAAAARIQHRGLSPRVRGNLLALFQRAIERGSIPACAGEPARRRSRNDGARVYPRVCGGTYWQCVWRHRGEGLSPRVRGNPSVANRPSQNRGSIPACAGEPVDAVEAEIELEVYPRVCGGTTG